LLEDFHELRDKVEKCGLYRPSPGFYVAIVAHILFFDALGWWTMKTFGTGWLSYIVAAVFLTVAQVCFVSVAVLLGRWLSMVRCWDDKSSSATLFK